MDRKEKSLAFWSGQLVLGETEYNVTSARWVRLWVGFCFISRVVAHAGDERVVIT